MDPTFDTGLTDAQRERLALVLEELGETAQAIGKILRHGYESYNPYLPPPAGETNRGNLERELGDLVVALALLTDAGDITEDAVEARAWVKINKVGAYLHFQPNELLTQVQERFRPYDQI